ncbi:MAG: hypothetical protein EOO04_27910 [Chitinophagaceae bacterium]|nr:MAG: hypothetical protein EOO04_27910 [Chitinophagaceae bacterium]
MGKAKEQGIQGVEEIKKSFDIQRKEPATSRSAANTAYQHKAGLKMNNVHVESNQMKHAINTKGTAATNGRMMDRESFGPVSMNPTNNATNNDDNTGERIFNSPQSVSNFENTVGNLAGNNMVHRDIAARNIISGRLTWVSPSNNNVGIITNNNINTSDRQTPNTSFGEKVKVGIRETASGQAKALKQYGIILADQGSAYASALGAANDNPQYRKIAITDNPLYQENGLSGENPLFESNAIHTNPLYQGNSNAGTNPMSEKMNGMSGAQTNPLYSEKGIQENGIRGMNVALTDKETGQLVASTTTTESGNFFFANVPDGAYVVKLSGAILRQEGFDLAAKSKIDLLGKIQHGDEQMQLLLSTGEQGMERRAGMRPNVRTRAINLVEADLDGDGQYEATRVMMELSDGTVQDVTASSKINNTKSVKKVTVKGWDPEKKLADAGNTQNEYTISVDAEGQVSLLARETNGSVKDIPRSTTVSRRGNVSQAVIIVDGIDDQLAMDDQKIKTKSNIKNDRMMSNSDHYTPQGVSGYSRILNQATVDIDGDGIAESLLSGSSPGAADLSGAMMRPGQPIGGIIVKGGKNPGGSLRVVRTNEYGEFEFNKLDAGDYKFIVEQQIIIEDEIMLVMGSNSPARKGWDGTVKGGNIVSEFSSERKGWDGTVKGGNIVSEFSSERKGWDGTVKGSGKEISTFMAALAVLDQLLASDQKSSSADIRIAKEHNARLRASVHQLENNPAAIQNGISAVDTNFAILLGSVNKLGSEYQAIGNILKTKHDTAKNSVGNIR